MHSGLFKSVLGATTLKQPFLLGVAPLAFECYAITDSGVTGIPCQYRECGPLSCGLVASLGARGPLSLVGSDETLVFCTWERIPIRLPFACPYVVDFGDILPFKGLLLVTMRKNKDRRSLHVPSVIPVRTVASISIGGVSQESLVDHCLDGSGHSGDLESSLGPDCLALPKRLSAVPINLVLHVAQSLASWSLMTRGHYISLALRSVSRSAANSACCI
ncbi:hypothetical protein Tco_0795786 [Tanacetum coccineum]